MTVSPREATGDLNPVLKRLIERQRSLRQPLRERLPLEVLHHQEVDAVLCANVVEHADVWVIERRDRARLLLEPAPALGIRGGALRQHLDGNGAAQAGVDGPVNLAHAARADGGLDFVGPEPNAGGQCHRASFLAPDASTGAPLSS